MVSPELWGLEMCGLALATHLFIAPVTSVQLPGQANKRATHLPGARAKGRSKV